MSLYSPPPDMKPKFNLTVGEMKDLEPRRVFCEKFIAALKEDLNL